MDKRYDLYHTFSTQEQPKTKFTIKQKNKLIQFLSNLGPEHAEAVFMLICEHARVCDNYKPIVNNDKNYVLNLPYKLQQHSNNVEFNIKHLPNNLVHILWKFYNVVSPQNENK
jgi:hypothetical protein